MYPARHSLAVAFVLCGCNLPHDADDTLKRVRGGVLRAGFVVDTPWVTDSAPEPGGIEPAAIRSLATRLGARVEWRRGTEAELLLAVHERKLDVVLAGLADDTPWKQQVGLTLPYHTEHVTYPVEHEEKHVLAAPPGENAWLMELDRALQDAKERGRINPGSPASQAPDASR